MVLISVIMGVYNIEKLAVFPKAVQSVLDQTVEDFEFLICDDGSTDSTCRILQAYAMQDARIRLLHNRTRQGLAAALNKCIASSRGSFLARQDADDISCPKRFEMQIEFLRQHPDISFAGTRAALYDMHGNWGRRVSVPYPRKEDFLFTNPFVHGSLMFCRDAFAKAGTYQVAKQTRRAEDYELLMRMYASGLRGANLPQTLYRLLEDADAWKRRKYRYRLDEAKVRLQGYYRLGLLPRGLPYVLKPLAVGLLPHKLVLRLKQGHTIQIRGKQ